MSAGFKNPNWQMRGQDYDYQDEGFDKFSNGRHDRDRDLRGSDGRGRVRQRDIKERDLANGGGYRSSSSRSNSGGSGDTVGVGVGAAVGGPRRCGYSVKVADREPGELSSEGGSDGATESDSRANGVQPPPAVKKRKFSPIVWDKDDKGVNDRSRSGVLSSTTSLSQSVVSKVDQQSLYVVEKTELSVVSVNKSEASESPLGEVPTEDYFADNNDVVESHVDLPQSVSHEGRWGNHGDAVHLEDEEYIPTRHISASRWAGDATSPADEADDEVVQKRRRKMPSSERLSSRRSKSLSSPETGEGTREVLDVTKGRSSDTDESMLSRPSSADRDIQINHDKKDRMELDDDYNDSDISLSSRETDSEDEDYSRRIPEPSAPPKRAVNMLMGCRSVDEFERLNKIDEGTYGVVYRAKDKKTGEIVALKKVKMEKEREGFPLTSLREINILLSLHHPSIVDVKEVVVGSNLDSIFMVMEYMEHDLKGLMETMRQPYSQSEVKCLMLQLLDGIKYLHDNWVLHRDLKTSNLLLNNQGELKICDFGLARQYGSPLKPYTHLVVTLWYRAPELLLGAKEYSTAIDMWSLGCIMAELLSKEPLFNGKTEFDQLDKIFRILGTPNETIWPGMKKLPGVKVNFVKHQYNQLRKKFPATSFTGSPVLSDAGFDLLNRLLTYDPEKRITADAALKHEWFREVPLPKSKEFMPTFPAQHAQDRRMRRMLKSPDPLEEQRRKELQQAELGTGGLFG
ncbi:cyclin-dependent kinase G-2 [Silene latifolia]|uniref:cyclin-dependent kinase G-2 n=1 Tax=Silene latifolia TaxID=37657 RepID=UPI003D7721F1